MAATPLTVVDLFAGVGGLSLGFELAGATIVAAVESNPHHVKAYTNGHRSEAVMISGYVEELSSSEIIKLTSLQRGELDFLIGGPPCQPFSMAGKRHGTADDRGNLVWQFVRFVDELRPRVFVMENVLGLRSIHGGSLFRDLLSALRSHSYNCETLILDAAEYGVPQVRKRLFIIGTRVDGVSISVPKPTHSSATNMALMRPHLPRPRTVRDAIWDLHGSRYQTMSNMADDTIRLPYFDGRPNAYQKLMRGRETAVSGNGVTAHFPHILINIHASALPEGSTEPSTRYRRLFWDRPSYTLRAGSGSFTALRPIHPSQPRVITVREAARLQSFPDHIQFSSIKKWAYQQIGNSVPPLLGLAIAKNMIRALSRARTRAVSRNWAG